MRSSTSDGGPHQAAEADHRAPKVNKACVPCRARKVKCDAAIVGIPCTSCRNQQCAEDCVPRVRQKRTRKGMYVPSSHNQPKSSPATSHHREPDNHSMSEVRTGHSPGQTEPDLLYLRILNDAVEETPGSNQFHTTSSTPHQTKAIESLTPRNCLSTEVSHLDEVDRDYLIKKGVFDLPPPHLLGTLVKTYFDHVHPFCPVINRADFFRRYTSGDCSLLLLRVMLTTASVHAPADVIFECGFADRSAAQVSFFRRARLLYDLAPEDDLFVMLQASILLTTVILDHRTERDFGYWFHNAIGFATKLNLRNIVRESNKPSQLLKQYRRVWWLLYYLDIFHVFVNVRHSRLLEDSTDIKPRTEDDWDDEDILPGSSDLLSAVTPQQRASPVVLCELARIFGECLSIVKSQPHQDPRQMMYPLSAWRKSLASKMHVGSDLGTNMYYLHIQAISYRFECVLCRLMRRTWQRFDRADWSEWAKQRLRSAMLELDTITMRVLASGTLEDFPTPFITTITALLALHIESALDPNETHLIRSMSRISISQTMLALMQGREIPVLKRALPVFEEILVKNNLNLVAADSSIQSDPQASTRPSSQDNSMADAYAAPQLLINGGLPQVEQWDNTSSLDIDFLGFDFSDEWQQFGQLEFPA